MKTRKIIGGLLGCLMLCGILVGCSGNDSNSNPNSNYRKGTVTESKFTSESMEIQYTLPSDMTMLSEETIASGSKDNIQVEMQAYLTICLNKKYWKCWQKMYLRIHLLTKINILN